MAENLADDYAEIAKAMKSLNLKADEGKLRIIRKPFCKYDTIPCVHPECDCEKRLSDHYVG